MQNLIETYNKSDEFIEKFKDVYTFYKNEKNPELVDILTVINKMGGQIKNFDAQHVTEIPQIFTTFEDLTTIHIAHSKISKLPKDFEKLQKLSMVIINDSKIKKFPIEFYNLPNLKILTLDKNQITGTIDMSKFKTKSLVEITLYDNPKSIKIINGDDFDIKMYANGLYIGKVFKMNYDVIALSDIVRKWFNNNFDDDGHERIYKSMWGEVLKNSTATTPRKKIEPSKFEEIVKSLLSKKDVESLLSYIKKNYVV
jgi:hypothetical protein